MLAMTKRAKSNQMRNVQLYPWFQFFRNLIFWQAIWFLFFQNELSAADAILLYVIYDIATTALEVPSGYMSDRIGRRFTLIASALCGALGAILLSFGAGFTVFALAQICLGASTAFASGTDSALLYESLASNGQEDDTAKHELTAWRVSFSALAVSAALGGVMATQATTLPFIASYAAFVCAFLISLRFVEPPRAARPIPQGAELLGFASLKSAFTQPVLLWLFALSVLMYGFSHIPFVFGQPFILAALTDVGLQANAPLVSGLTSATMMVLSVITSLYALRLRTAMGLPAILIMAFAMQIALIAMMAVTDSMIVIVLLLFRMVPDSISWPFLLARIQPMLSDDSRATYLSLQSFFGRLLFAATLYFAALSASDAGQMPYADIQQVLGWYTFAGLSCLLGLAAWSTWLHIEGPDKG